MPEAVAAALATESAPAPVTTPAPQPVTVVDQPKPSMEDTMAAAYDKLNPARESNGQFKGEQPKAVETQEAAPADKTTETEGQTQTDKPVEPAPPAIDAPQSLSAEMKAKWASLPPEWQQTIAKRESEATKRITEMGQAVKAFEPIRELMEPLRQSAARNGVSEREGLEQLLAANAFLERDPAGAIQWLAKAYGVDLGAKADTQQQDGQGQPESGELRALKAELATLKQQLTDTRQRVTARDQQDADAQKSNLTKLVEDFAKGKDYWDEIEGDVLEQIHAIRKSDANLPADKVLEKAHARALKLNESVAAKLNEAARKDEEAKKAAEAKRKADEAKRLASLNPKSSQGASPKSKGNWEQTMRETADRLMG